MTECFSGDSKSAKSGRHYSLTELAMTYVYLKLFHVVNLATVGHSDQHAVTISERSKFLCLTTDFEIGKT